MRYISKDREIVAFAAVLIVALAGLGIALADEASADESATYTFYGADGSTVIMQYTVEPGADVTVPTAPAVTGKEFAYWGDSASATSAATIPAKAVAGESKYYAIYSDIKNTYSIVVDGVTIASGDDAGSATTFAGVSAPTKAGYEFAGWSDGSAVAKLADGSIDADLTTAIKAQEVPTVYTATWTPALLTVTFAADGKTVLTETVQYNSLAVEPAVQPAKEGYTFEGWDYDFAVPITEDTTVNAVYKVVEVVVPATVTYIVDGLTVASPETPAKEGYRFIGWSDGSQVVKAADLSAYVAGLAAGSDVTLTAVWEAEVYTVSFVSEGVTVLTQSVRYGEFATMPAMVPSNIDFDHWAWDFATPITADTAIQAVAVEVVYHTVTFDYGYPGVASVSVTVADGQTVAELPTIYPYMGDVEWSITTETPITADVTATLQAVAPVEPDEPESDSGDSDVALEIAVVVVVLAVLAALALICIQQGVPAKAKAKAEARKTAKAAKKADAGKEQPKP